MSTRTTKSDPAAALLHSHRHSSETDDDADVIYDATNGDADTER